MSTKTRILLHAVAGIAHIVNGAMRLATRPAKPRTWDKPLSAALLLLGAYRLYMAYDESRSEPSKRDDTA